MRSETSRKTRRRAAGPIPAPPLHRRRAGSRTACGWLVLLSVLVLAACDAAPPAAPRLVIPTPDRDLGTHDFGERLLVAWTLSNPGPGEVRVARVDPGCGCAVARLERDVVPAGETTELELTVRLDAVGRARKVARVFLAGREDPEQLSFEVTVRAPWRLEPETVDFGTVRSGEIASASVTIHGLRDAPLVARAVRRSGRGVHGEITKTPGEDREEPTVVTLHWRPDASTGPFTDSVVVEAGPQGVYGNVVVPVRGDVAGALAIDPPEIAVAELAGRAVIDARIALTWRDGRDEEIVVESIGAGHPELDASLVESRPGAAIVAVSGAVPQDELEGARLVVRVRGSGGLMAVAPYRLPER